MRPFRCNQSKMLWLCQIPALRYNPDMSQANVSALLTKYGIEVPGAPAPKASGSPRKQANQRQPQTLAWSGSCAPTRPLSRC